MPKELDAIAETTSGRLKGCRESGLLVFKGVRYASPPLGKARWLSPQPLKPWKGIVEATSFGTIAPQPETKLPAIHEFEAPEVQNEDCLFLNVWTPGLDNARRPVMVWIHGGAFSMGSGTMANYRGGKLSSKGNVVLVTINYRLGVLGFMNLNEVTRGRMSALGSEGLQDQIAALEWVRDNIAFFGGDPNNVTIFGESAGAMSVGCLMALPSARGLFHRAILESTVGDMARPLERSIESAEVFMQILGVRAESAETLREFTAERILAAQSKMAEKMGLGIAPAIPVVDGKYFPKMPLPSIQGGSAKDVPVIVGSNLEEWKLFAAMAPRSAMDENALMKRVERLVPAGNAEKLIGAYRQSRSLRGEPATPEELYSAVQTDTLFRMPALNIVEAQCKYEQAAFNYLFTWKSPAMGGVLGACHALEIGFVFGTYDRNFCGVGPEADKLSNQMQDAWIAFARSGNPSCETLGKWPEYCDKRSTMVLGADSHVEESPYEGERSIWQSTGFVKPDNMP